MNTDNNRKRDFKTVKLIEVLPYQSTLHVVQEIILFK